MTTYSFVSVPKKGSNAGRPKGKRPYVILFDWKDVATYTRDEKGVKVSDFALKAGAHPIAVYATDSTIKAYHTSEGDDDARGYIHHVEFEHPGTSLEFDEFTNNNINSNLGAILIGCDNTLAKIFGTPSTPLKMVKSDSDDSKDSDKNIINLATTLRTGTTGYMDKSLVPSTDDAGINSELGLPTPPPPAEKASGL